MTGNEYHYDTAEATFTSGYLWPVLVRVLREKAPPPRGVFEIGCGNGATAGMLTRQGYRVVAVDSSESGIATARAAQPEVGFQVASVYDDLAGRFGRFPVVLSLEVIEHCPDSHGYIQTFANLLEDGGIGIISTPYHGYLKNLAVAGSGKFDHHFDPLWRGGHLKFFSIRKLRELFAIAGLSVASFHRVGRIPLLAKSVVAVVRR